MKNKEIEQFKGELIDAQDGDFGDQYKALSDIAKKLGLSAAVKDSTQQLAVLRMVEKIHMHLQTETMINTIRVTKWSCFWAALAAIASLVAVAVTSWSVLK